MADDLKTRLRAKNRYVYGGIPMSEELRNPDGPEAAARIDELESALEEIRACTSEHGGAAKALKIINAALKEPAP